MAIVDLVQRSEAWHEWRKQGITASMIPVIMGLSSYQTPYQLWAELVGLKEPDDLSNNFHVQRGVEQEPEARDAVENEYGRPYMPVCVEADHEPLFKASLDGLYKSGNDSEVLEIKCPCEKIYNEILEQKAKAPTFKMYASQVQWQLNCSGATQGRLYFYLRGKRPISTAIRRNDAFIAQAEEKARQFWNLVQTKTPPEMIEGRDKVVYDTPVSSADNSWEARVNQYKEKQQRLSEIESKAKAIKADLKQLESYFTEQIPDGLSTFDKDGIRATKVERQGNVDYNKVLADIERHFNGVIPQELIEDNRKEGTSYYRITVTNSEPDQAEPSETPSVQSEPEPVSTNVQTQPEETKSEPEVETQPKVPLIHQPIPQGNFHEKSQSNMFF